MPQPGRPRLRPVRSGERLIGRPCPIPRTPRDPVSAPWGGLSADGAGLRARNWQPAQRMPAPTTSTGSTRSSPSCRRISTTATIRRRRRTSGSTSRRAARRWCSPTSTPRAAPAFGCPRATFQSCSSEETAVARIAGHARHGPDRAGCAPPDAQLAGQTSRSSATCSSCRSAWSAVSHAPGGGRASLARQYHPSLDCPGPRRPPARERTHELPRRSTILGCGMTTAVGLTAPASCAAIRARLDGFRETRFMARGRRLARRRRPDRGRRYGCDMGCGPVGQFAIRSALMMGAGRAIRHR